MTRTIEKPNYTAETAPESEAEARNLPPSLLATALRAPLRHWKLTLAGAVVSAAVAAIAGLALSEKSWKAEGVLVYTQVPLPESRRGTYSPQKLETLIAIIKSTSDLETLRQEFDLPLTVEVLNKKIKVEQEPRSEKVSVSVEWGDRDTGPALINRLMELHARHVSSIQKGKTDEMMATLQTELKEYQSQRDAARAELVDFLSKKDIVDIRKDRDRLDKDVADAEKELTEAKDKAASYPQQIRDLDDEIAKVSDDMQTRSLADLGRRVEQDRDYLKRKRELEEGIREEMKRRVESEKEYQGADRDASSAEGLVRKDAFAPVEADKLRAKAELLRVKITNSLKRQKEMEEDIRQLPRDFFQIKVADLRKKRSDLQEESRMVKAKIGRLEESLAAVRQRKEKRLAVLSEGEVMEKKYKELDARRLQTEEQLGDLRTLGSEVKIDTPATPQRDAFSSNFKKIAAVSFALPLALLLGGMVLFDAVSNVGTPRTLARRLGLPVLGRFPTAGKAAVPAESRAMALRIRQAVTAPGGVVLFAPLSGPGGVNELVCDVSRYLALQDEKVLILDGRIAESQEQAVPPWVSPLATAGVGRATGLVQYLVFEGQSIWHSILPTRLPGVEYLPAGGPCSTADVLASQQMRDMLEELRRYYSLILVTGPSADHPIDTEILSGYADGVLAVVQGPAGNCPPAAGELLRSLQEGGVPVLGAVVCE
jgi:capsular polysaccharide biosynthesis protein/Mrp family chromosome partitioning ATPase